MKDLKYIEEYIKGRKYNTPELSTLWDIAPDGEIRYWARFSMLDDEDEDYTDYVQATGDNPEETLGKIVEYIKSGKHYSDGRYL